MYLGVRIIEIKEKIDLVVEKVGIKVEIRKPKRHIYEEPKRMYQIINKQGKRITNLWNHIKYKYKVKLVLSKINLMNYKFLKQKKTWFKFMMETSIRWLLQKGHYKEWKNHHNKVI